MIRFARFAAGILACLTTCPTLAQEKHTVDKEIAMHPIGVVHSPYKEAKGTPIQGVFDAQKDEAWIELKDEYAKGLTDLDGFSHVILLYHFHLSGKEEIVGKPYLEGRTRHLRHAQPAPTQPHRAFHRQDQED